MGDGLLSVTLETPRNAPNIKLKAVSVWRPKNCLSPIIRDAPTEINGRAKKTLAEM